jgi:hypothetical protein
MLLVLLTLFSAVSFLYYGILCLSSKKMVLEFQRFGLTASQRRITGIAQVLGSTGLVVGLWVQTVGVIASGGLAILMLLGFGVRIIIRDRFILMLPAFFFMLLNVYLVLAYMNVL